MLEEQLRAVAGPDAYQVIDLARTNETLIPGVDGRPGGRVELVVGGTAVGRTVLGERWRRTRITVPARCLRGGLETLELRWPELPPVGTEALEGARRRLELGIEAELHPVFGEVASLRLRR